MSYHENDGCLSALGALLGGIWGLIVIVAGYLIALSFLGNTHEWWHYLAAIPLAVVTCAMLGAEWAIALWSVVFGLIWNLLKLLGIPAVSVALTIGLLSQNGGLAAAGIGFLLFSAGIAFAVIAVKQRSAGWAINSLTARFFGLLMVISGLIAFVF